MEIETLRMEIIEWVQKTDDTSLLETLKSIVDSKNTDKDWYDDLNEEEIASLNRGIKNYKNGEVLTSKEFFAGHGD